MPLSLAQRTFSEPDHRSVEPLSRPDGCAPLRIADSEPAPSGVASLSSEASRLTPRERDVLVHLLAGGSYKKIAAALGLSTHTVHDHVKNIFRRLRIASRGELQARFRQPNAPLPHDGSPAALRPREREVLAHLLAGYPYKTVATRMGISIHTVHDYVKAIFREFGVSSKGALLARFNSAPAA
jgi:DNA-binding CsgD family transcriptional regulator